MKKSFTTVEEAFDFIGSFINFERNLKQTIRDYRLDRMKSLLAHFGNPEHDLHCIHIAGSKGKGSTGAFIASGITGLGISTGLYSSPHVVTYRERITGNGSFFEDSIYLEQIRKIESGLRDFKFGDDTGCGEPTAFELLTVLAFMIFHMENIRWGVIETGIGGRLDATNVISPVASVITPIELEHTDILGSTIEEIAREKAGIIKPGAPVFCGYLTPQVEDIIVGKAGEMNSPLFLLREKCRKYSVHAVKGHTEVEALWDDGTVSRFSISMMGDFQAENALTAFMVLREIFSPEAEEEKRMLDGLRTASLPGRMEIIPGNPPLVIDAAHTPSSIRRAASTFFQLYSKGGVLLFGAVKGKDISGMIQELVPLFDTIIISKPNIFKESEPEEVHRLFKLASPDPEKVYLREDPADALNLARTLCSGNGRGIFVTGSFYMVCEIKRIIHEDPSQ